MKLTALDWAVIAAYFLFNIAIGLYYKKRAGKSISEFFLSGQKRSLVAGRHFDGGDDLRR